MDRHIGDIEGVLMVNDPGQTPGIGRIVHYVGGSGAQDACHAAIVVATGSDEAVVDLCVFEPTGTYHVLVPFDEQYTPHSWHWPERVP